MSRNVPAEKLLGIYYPETYFCNTYIYIFFIISIRSIDGRFIDDTAYIIPLADGMHSEQAWLKRTGK